jgi:hypothetical protein
MIVLAYPDDLEACRHQSVVLVVLLCGGVLRQKN